MEPESPLRSTKPASLAFRGDVEEARRKGILRNSDPDMPTVTGRDYRVEKSLRDVAATDDDDASEESELSCDCCTSYKLWIVLAFLLGTAGTVLGVLNLTDEEDLTGLQVQQANIANNGAFNNNNSTDTANNPYDSATLNAIRERGLIKCGLPFTSTPGFAYAVPGTSNPVQFVGLDVDLCRAVAAAVLGDATQHELVELTGGTERWTNLHAGQVDLVLRSTWTAERDVYEPTAQTGFTFSTPYYYDALQVGGIPEFATCANAKDTSSSETCANLRVCVQGGTTHESVMKEHFPDHVVVVPDQESLYLSFQDGVCNVVASESHLISQATMARHGYNGDYQVGHDPADTNTTTTYL